MGRIVTPVPVAVKPRPARRAGKRNAPPAGADGAAEAASRRAGAAAGHMIATLRGFDSSARGSAIVSTPSAKVAWIASVLTLAGSVKVRVNVP